MKNFFKTFYRWLFNLDIKKQESTVAYPLEKELIERDTLVKKLVKKLNAQDAQLSKISAEKREEEEEEKGEERDQKLIEKIKKQKKEIENKKYGGTFSFNNFYYKKFKFPKIFENLELTDKTDTKIFGKFGSFVILPDTYFGITDSENNLVSYGKTLRQVIYKPESLGNQIRRGRILLPCDKDGIFYPDIEEQMLPESIYNEVTGKIKWAKVSEKPLKQLIIDKDRRIIEDNSYIERLEKTKSKLARNNTRLIREIKILKDNKETTRVELSKAINLQKGYYKNLGTLQNKIVILEQKQWIAVKLRSGLEDINKELLKKSEEMGVKTEFSKTLLMLQHLISWAKDKVPKTVYQTASESPSKEIEKGIVKPEK